ncbi:MAG: hypothetical protein FJX59_21500, partial [Alphaproteobacteria bacterium]|nr:hypothetical protein [Alphaproteobacteria bacterium]
MTSEVDPTRMARDQLVLALLPQVPFDGWTQTALKVACAAEGLAAADARLLFPGGGTDAIRHFVDMADRMMIADYVASETSTLRLRDK